MQLYSRAFVTAADLQTIPCTCIIARNPWLALVSSRAANDNRQLSLAKVTAEEEGARPRNHSCGGKGR